VQTQNAELIYPVGALCNQFFQAFYRMALECDLEDSMATYSAEFVSPPTQPHVTIYNGASPKIFKAIAASPFQCTLPPDDLARLAADPTKRARWVELATHTLMPLVRKLMPIIQAKVRQKTRAHSSQRKPPLTTRPF
jgi:hypothetical protein